MYKLNVFLNQQIEQRQEILVNNAATIELIRWVNIFEMKNSCEVYSVDRFARITWSYF